MQEMFFTMVVLGAIQQPILEKKALYSTTSCPYE